MPATHLRTPADVGKRALGLLITCARAEAEWFWQIHAHQLTPDSRAARRAAIADEQAKLAAWLSAESLWDVLTPFEAPLTKLDAGTWAKQRVNVMQVLMTSEFGLPILMWAAGRDRDHRSIPWTSFDDRTWSITGVPIGLSANTLAHGVALRNVSEIAALRQRCVDRIAQDASQVSKHISASDKAATANAMTLEEFLAEGGEISIRMIDWLTDGGDWDAFYA